ncbi:MAG: two-component system response regulator CreB [Aquificaceae bacterium]|nr:MAG: two-component system response regulator CreB [Aquificaceae bacterium]
MKANILIVDDDAHIREVIAFALEKADMQVLHAADGQAALTLIQQNPHIDLIVLDINMPEMDGLEMCRELRKTSQTPILFLSSRDDEIDRILGLELGGDDYVTKPFSPRELVARIHAILKRLQPRPITAETHIIQHKKLKIDDEQHAIWWDNKSISLTATEFAIIKQMARYPTKVYSREAIMNSAYEYNIHVSDRTIDSHIRHIRAKFSEAGCEKIIETLHGVGYKLSSCQ